MTVEKDQHSLDSWAGDFDELQPYVEDLLYDEDLCDRVFRTKLEAFAAGLHVVESNVARQE